jgi:sulfite exporter TauE/SafE
MHPALVMTVFFMGLAGGPHCLAMCGAACAGINKKPGKVQAIWQFHVGRMFGYAVLGAVAAASVRSLAWFTSHSAALQPVWTLFHVLVLSWGLVLLAYARQPLWVEGLGSGVWAKVRQLSRLRGGIFFTGGLWAFMPCGLLYSALLVAALGGSPLGGALGMAAFGLGTSISLQIGSLLWLKLQQGNQQMGMRIAGLLLTLVAGWAIWMDATHHASIWCI